MSCCSSRRRTGYSSPLDAYNNGPKEKLLYVTAISTKEEPDALITIDVDPESDTNGKAIHTLRMPYVGDELHHSGWNICSSCFREEENEDKRKFLVLPGVQSNRIYFVDTSGAHARAPKIPAIVEPSQISEKVDLAVSSHYHFSDN
jgi:selenium-binding protein 1